MISKSDVFDAFGNYFDVIRLSLLLSVGINQKSKHVPGFAKIDLKKLVHVAYSGLLILTTGRGSIISDQFV